MGFKRILWVEDQYEDFTTFRSPLYRGGRVTDRVKSVSEAIEILRKNGEEYIAVILDLRVLPGNDPKWINFDRRQKKTDPHHDPHLGLELLRALFAPDRAEVKIKPPIQISPKKIIVFSAVPDKTKEIAAMGIPGDRIIYKAECDLNTLPGLIDKIEEDNNNNNNNNK